MTHLGPLATIKADKLKKTERRDEACGTRNKFARMARMEQAIDKIPDTTATKVVEKVTTVIQAEADWVKAHITEELDARLGPRLDESNLKTVHAINMFMVQERADLKFKETRLRHSLAQNQEQEKAQKKDEKAAKKQRRT